ncbi:MAG: hypothetical protein NC131_19025 [Roseburia sp.]|nr:hypothetical protein [Roseburia sp.]
MTNSVYIPAEVGTQRLLSFTEAVAIPDRYRDVVQFCAENICNVFKKDEEKQYYTNILDLLKFRGEDEDE